MAGARRQWQWLVEWVVPHSCVVDKIGRDTLGESNPSPRPDRAAQGSSTGKIKPHNFCLLKSVVVGKQNKLLVSGESLFKGPAQSQGKCKPIHSGNHHWGSS